MKKRRSVRVLKKVPRASIARASGIDSATLACVMFACLALMLSGCAEFDGTGTGQRIPSGAGLLEHPPELHREAIPSPTEEPSFCLPEGAPVTETGTRVSNGHRLMTFVITNTSDDACTLYGYPFFALHAADSSSMLTRVRRGSSYLIQDSYAERFALAPGETASTSVAWDSGKPGRPAASIVVAASFGDGGSTFVPPETITPESNISVTCWVPEANQPG